MMTKIGTATALGLALAFGLAGCGGTGPQVPEEVTAVGEFGAERPESNISSTSAAITPGGVAGDTDVLAPPVAVRSWRYRDADTNPACVTIAGGAPSGAWTTLLTKTFHTPVTTTYVELNWSGQFTVKTGTGPFNGLLGRASLTWTGELGTQTARFPGMGDDFEPWVARRDNNAVGQQAYASYVGVLGAPADTDVTLVVEVQSWDTSGTACFQNFVVRND